MGIQEHEKKRELKVVPLPERKNELAQREERQSRKESLMLGRGWGRRAVGETYLKASAHRRNAPAKIEKRKTRGGGWGNCSVLER